jgi:hypothetical protein
MLAVMCYLKRNHEFFGLVGRPLGALRYLYHHHVVLVEVTTRYVEQMDIWKDSIS